MSHNCQIHPWPLLLLEDSVSQLSSFVSVWDLVWDRIKSMHLSAVDIHLLISVTSCFLFSLFFAGSSPQPVHLPGQLRFRTTLLPRGIQPGWGWEMLTWLQPPRGLLKHALQDCTLALPTQSIRAQHFLQMMLLVLDHALRDFPCVILELPVQVFSIYWYIPDIYAHPRLHPLFPSTESHN